MNKEKLIRISIEQYFTWVLCNVIFSALPIGILCLVEKLNGDLNLPIVFSSILALLFTLMIVGLYIFLHFSRLKGSPIYDDILTFGSMFVAVIILVAFVLYNVMPEAQQWMNGNMDYWGFLLVAVVLAILLNRPAIEDRILKKQVAVVDATFKEGQQKGAKWIKDITSRGGK
jgi:predicted neutral ceramidase superfamily lipid hydrolase